MNIVTNDLEQKSLTILEQADHMTIVGTDTYKQAATLLLVIKDVLKELSDTFDPIVAKTHAAWKETLAQRKRHEEPLLRAESVLKPRIAAYIEAEDQKAKAEQKKAQEAATLQEAMDAEARGDQPAAEAALNGQGVVAVNVASAAPKVAGIAPRENWSAEITDKLLLIKAVANGIAPLELLDVNQSVANQMARTLKNTLAYPGLKPVCVKTIAAGSRL